ncbi:MAG: RDD family protein [Tannerella sp.]|nr:RDD family protein [Tannerella sp.]
MAESTIITGQYVQIDQTPASVGERILARFIDIILMSLYYFSVYAFIGVYMEYIPYAHRISSDSMWILVLVLAAPALLYSLLWELFNHGRSPGKKLLGLRVVMKDGTAPSFNAYLLRWLLLAVDISLSQCIGVLSILLTKNNQRIGDLAAGTLVIKEKNYHRINVTLDEFRHLSVNYRPVFPQAENLSLEQINLINQTLFRYDPERSQRIRELAFKVRQFLRINPPMDDEALLQILTRDYQYYALEEI